MDALLDITAIVLANLCVSYIMTSQNADAEELMKCVEKEEERIAIEEPTKQVFHLCIVNLVIGTLYCGTASSTRSRWSSSSRRGVSGAVRGIMLPRSA